MLNRVLRDAQADFITIDLDAFAAAFIAAGATSAMLLTWQALPEANNFKPQFTMVSAVGRNVSMVVVAIVHFEVAPQPPAQATSLRSSSTRPRSTLRRAARTPIPA